MQSNLYDITAGTFLVAGLTENNFGSLTPEQVEKLSDLFRQPQVFVKIGDEIQAIPVEPLVPVGTYELYQLKDSADARLRFASFDRATEQYGPVTQRNYESVYSGELHQGETLDSIYERFNRQHPSDFSGHSLSVSDVIVLHKEGQDQAWYVDSFGFQQVPEFFAQNPLQKAEELLEDDYGMIDGIINNGDREKGSAPDKRPSVMERLQEKKAEAAQLEQPAPKPTKKKAQDVSLS